MSLIVEKKTNSNLKYVMVCAAISGIVFLGAVATTLTVILTRNKNNQDEDTCAPRREIFPGAPIENCNWTYDCKTGKSVNTADDIISCNVLLSNHSYNITKLSGAGFIVFELLVTRLPLLTSYGECHRNNSSVLPSLKNNSEIDCYDGRNNISACVNVIADDGGCSPRESILSGMTISPNTPLQLSRYAPANCPPDTLVWSVEDDAAPVVGCSSSEVVTWFPGLVGQGLVCGSVCAAEGA